MSLFKSGQVITPTFTVTDPAGTGLINADSLPTGALYVNGVINAAIVTVTNLSTGKYKATVTLPSLSAGDTVSLMISATVGGKAHADNVWQGIGDTVRLSDLATAAALTTVAGYVDTEVAAILTAQSALAVMIASLNDMSPTEAQAAAAAALAAYPAPLIADIEAAIAAGSGATPETFWNYIGPGGRTLSQSMIAILSSMIAGSAITITRGDTISITITGLGNLEDRTGLWFTVKANPSKETDLQARIQMTEIDGLVRLNGKAATDPTDGGVVVDDEANGDITVTLTAEASAALASAASWHWDVQVAQPGPGVWTPRTGAFVVTADVTRAT